MIDLKYQLLEELLNHFHFNEWKKTYQLARKEPFTRWSEAEVKNAVYALEIIGLLEKREGTNTSNKLYRLTTNNARWWKTKLEIMLQEHTLPEKMTFRALCVFFVIAKCYEANGKPPKQSELLYKAEDGTFKGLINSWFELSGAVAEDPHMLGGEPHLRQATALLGELGYLVERGTKLNPQPYMPTPKGMALYHRIKTMHWMQWKQLF